MLKVGLLCGVIAAMSAVGLKADRTTVEAKPCDARFIVELAEDIDNISADKAIKQQDALFNKIKRTVNSNATSVKHFTLLTNALVIEANKDDAEALRSLDGVRSVTEDGTHIVTKTEGSQGVSIDLRGTKAEIDLSQNASAITMNKPADTNDGEGTLIAVLDNEFYLRGQREGGDSFNHVAFTALDSDVKVRMTQATTKKLGESNKLNAKYKKGTAAGYEGSLYFNNKVPFYYDYAGDSANGNSEFAVPDFDVNSEIGLHGSHVASIAGANDPNYKGIAPKAQLVLMKVFADLHATDFEEAAKLGDGSRFSEIAFINALEDCIAIGVDAINVSIGSDLDDFDHDSITMRTISKLVNDNGILSAISAGNAGKSSYAFTGGYGNWSTDVVETGIIGSFANNTDATIVAAGQPVWTFYENSIRIGDNVIAYEDQIVNREGSTDYDTERRLVQLVSGSDDPEQDPTAQQQDIEVPYVYVNGFGKEADYKNKDVGGKIAVVNRGSTSFADKYTIAANHGAIALVIINNDPTATDFNFRCDFGGEQPSKPVVLALFKDKPIFDANPTGTLKIKKNTASENPLANTVSDYSSDGARYDLDLKPEITTPGSNIKGAVWPQNKKERLEENKYSSYEYFNGTSMAAPNYEGAMATVLSKYTKEMLADNELSTVEKRKLVNYRKTLELKMASTATAMYDSKANEEDLKKDANAKPTLTSPRMQGAGMVNIDGAYNTEVYLKGRDSDGTVLNKTKILLRNNEDIAKGDIKLSFTAVNEGNTAHSYKVKYSVLRPAKAYDNTVLTADYGTPVTVDSVKSIPGFSYYSPEEEGVINADGTAKLNDTIKVEKDINYFENAEQYNNDTPLGVFKAGMYYCSKSDASGITWEVVPEYTYQSVQDKLIATVDGPTITVPANGELAVNLDTYSLSDEVKKEIAEIYPYGTYIEGFVSLEAQENEVPDLSIPYMGFYSLTDVDADNSYSTAPVVEPFEFEKNKNQIYQSDLVKDVTLQLLGKEQADFGSMWLTGYAKNAGSINTDSILTNDLSFKDLQGFHSVGTIPHPYSEEYTENPGDNIYVGSPKESNTMIIQQFVLRSVSDNYFTIKNKATGEVIYTDALRDMLFGDTRGKNALYKSHVDGNYLGGGYVSHRAYAIVPLYDVVTREAFASGDYEITFNYLLTSTEKWVSKSYTMHVDSEAPVVKSIGEFKQDNKEFVRITYKDMRVAYARVGANLVDVKYDEANDVYYSDVEKSVVDSSMIKSATSCSSSRLFLTVVDYARGEQNAIVHFDGDYSHFVIAQGTDLNQNCDFKFENGKLSVIQIDDNGNESAFNYQTKVTVVDGSAVWSNLKLGCSGSTVSASLLTTIVVMIGAVLIILKKKKLQKGGK